MVRTHFYWLARSDRKMSFHIPQVFHLVSLTGKICHNGNDPWSLASATILAAYEKNRTDIGDENAIIFSLNDRMKNSKTRARSFWPKVPVRILENVRVAKICNSGNPDCRDFCSTDFSPGNSRNFNWKVHILEISQLSFLPKTQAGLKHQSNTDKLWTKWTFPLLFFELLNTFVTLEDN